MFGKNEITKPNYDAKGNLNVVEIFHTLQGEGPDAGLPAIFIRLQGCNLRCFFCDTDFSHGSAFNPESILQDAFSVATGSIPTLIVITGGEPLIQNILPLVDLSNRAGFAVSVETAGTICDHARIEEFGRRFGRHQVGLPNNLSNKIICSPKTARVDPALFPFIDAYKYVVASGSCNVEDGLPQFSTQIEGGLTNIARPHDKSVPVYLQAMDVGDAEQNQANLEYASALCIEYGYRLSCQLHKLAGLR